MWFYLAYPVVFVKKLVLSIIVSICSGSSHPSHRYVDDHVVVSLPKSMRMPDAQLRNRALRMLMLVFR